MNAAASKFTRWMVLATKAAKLTKLVKLLKVMKYGKYMVTFVSMFFATFAYALLFGVQFALGLVIMIFIHEMGHVIALKQKGFETKAPVFIPMLGAVIFAPPMDDRDTESYIGFGGPFVGTIGAYAVLALWYFMPSKPEILLLTAVVAFYINLFNLLPMRPLDGGRILQVFGERVKYFGIAALLIFTLFIRDPGILLIWLIVLDDINLKAKPKFYLALVCFATMVLLMLLGVGDQPWFLDIVDVILGIFFLILYEDNARKETDQYYKPDDRPLPANSVKMKWLFAYGAVGAAALYGIIYAIQHLPEEVLGLSHTAQMMM